MTFKSSAMVMVLGAAALLQAGCAGTYDSKYAYSNTFSANQPVKDENCYDAAVLLAVNPVRAKDIGTKVLAAVDSSLLENSETTLKAQRNRHLGLFIGSGGEELTITLKPVDAESTFVTITTKTGLVGGAGQRAWSCEIADKMSEMAARK